MRCSQRRGNLSRLALIATCFALVLVTAGVTNNVSNGHPPHLMNKASTSPASSSVNGKSSPSFMPARGASIQNPGFAAACGSGTCSDLTYHNGPIMHNPTNYLIFWLPPGYSFDNASIDITAANPSDAGYEQLIIQYFQDVCQPNAFYAVTQQYMDNAGPIGSCSLAGSWIDTSNYPGGRGTGSNPLTYTDLQNEVLGSLAANSTWSSRNGNSIFFIFTGFGVCTPSSSCPTAPSPYCAFHYWFAASDGSSMVYANMPDAGNVMGCQLGDYPNNDRFADSEINFVSHEQFEAYTDPTGSGWFYLDLGHEIGDECDWIFDSNGATLQVGTDNYRVQNEWSNTVHGCTSQGFGCAGTMLATNVLGCSGLGPSTIGLSWGRSGYGLRFTKYEVQRSVGGSNGPWSTVDTITTITNTTDYFENLSPSTAYWWHVVQFNNVAQSQTSNVVIVVQPTTSLLLYSQVSDTSFDLTWNNNAAYAGSVGFDSYKIEEQSGGGNFVPVQTITNSSQTNTTVGMLASSTVFSFYVNATDKCSTCSSLGLSTTSSSMISFATHAQLVASATASRAVVETGQQISFSCSAVGGQSPYSFAWSFGDRSTGIGQSVTHVYSSSGSVNVICTATDSLTSTADSRPIPIIITSGPSVIIQSNRSSTDVGQSILFTAQARGGSGVFSYTWSGLPSGCGSSATSSVSCLTNTPGQYELSLNVRDSNGVSGVAVLAFNVYDDPSISMFSVYRNSVDAGQTMSITTLVNYGSGGLTYSYSGLPPGCSSENTSVLSCTPSAEGMFEMGVSVSDSNGVSIAAGPVSVTVYNRLELSIIASPIVLDVNQSFTLTIVLQYQAPGFGLTSVQGLPQKCPFTISPFTCRATDVGVYNITVRFTDSIGGTISSMVTIRVNPALKMSALVASPARLEQGQNLKLTVSTTGGTQPVEYSYGGLPPGCIGTNSATISCHPSTAGTYRAWVTATDSTGATTISWATVTISPQTILGVPVLEGYSIIAGLVGLAVVGSVVVTLRVRRGASLSRSG